MSDSRQGGASAQAASPADPGQDKAPKSEQGPDPLIGVVVNGRFRIVSVIARGGMGKVYKAEQTPLGRICALKILNPKYEGDRDPEFHKRFFLEASTAAKLTHPNTVTIFDYGQSDDIYFIAMEYIEGKTLHRVLREDAPLQEARVAHIAGQICRSLREAHTMGVVHRDLKPGNILLSNKGDENDYVKVLDFGLVKDVTGAAEDLTQAGLFMGSPKYMAPEQILGTEITARTDVYSLGVMIYEMLSGKVPFDRGASVGTLMAHVNETPPPMQLHNPAIDISPGMEVIVKRCLEKKPDDRFPSMKALLEALKRLGGEGVADTYEGMPAASVPSSAITSQMPPSHPSGAFTNSSGSHPAPVFASPSMSESIVAAPDKTHIIDMPPRSSSRRFLWVVIAAVAAGCVFAFMRVRGVASVASEAPSATPTAAVATAAPSNEATPPSSTASAHAAPPPAPTVRVVRVETDPAGASVSENGVEICSATPCDVMYKGEAVSADHTLKLTKKGFKASKLSVAPADEKVSGKLDSPTMIAAPQANPGPSKPAQKPSDYKPSPY